MPITDTETWNKWVEANDDPYGKACIDVARRVMDYLDDKHVTTLDPHDMICKADKATEAGGITGFMAGCVAQMVSKVHSRGEEFRKAWNKDVGSATGQEDAEGVLNPALVTMEVEDGA